MINKPVIRHLWGITKEGLLSEKPWLLKKYYKIKVEWNYYAKKTGYYSSICNFFKYACINLKYFFPPILILTYTYFGLPL